MPEAATRVTRPAEIVLAFDYGARRIGVAVGQTQSGTASPAGALPARGAPDWATVERCVAQWGPQRLLVGVPYNMDGSDTVLTTACREFASELGRRTSLPVELVDERYSSVEVESRMRAAYGARKAVKLARGKTLDSQAAQLLLEQYFDGRQAT